MEQIAFFDTKPYDRTWFDQTTTASTSATLNTNSPPTVFLWLRDAVL